MRIKTFVVAVAQLFVLSSCCGQWRVDILAGGGTGRIRTDLYPIESRGEYQVVERRPSLFLGFTAGHTISGPLSFSTGLNWTMISGHDEYWIRGYRVSVSDRKVQYLYAPLIVSFEFHRMRIGGGYQLGVPIHGSGDFSQNYSWLGPDDRTYSTDDLGLRKVDLGVVGELAYRPLDRVTICARYYYGLQDVKDHSDWEMSPLWNEQLVVVVGYQLFPKRARDPEPKAVPEEIQEK
jgi:hypothetical protein